MTSFPKSRVALDLKCSERLLRVRKCPLNNGASLHPKNYQHKLQGVDFISIAENNWILSKSMSSSSIKLNVKCILSFKIWTNIVSSISKAFVCRKTGGTTALVQTNHIPNLCEMEADFNLKRHIRVNFMLHCLVYNDLVFTKITLWSLHL